MKFSVATSFAAVAAAASFAAAAPLQKRMHQGVTGTWFTQNGVAGSCGTVHGDDAMVVAVSAQKHDASNCGKTITIEANGVQQVATIADTCPGCGFEDLDLSTGLFQKFAGLDQGVITMNWWPNW